MRQWMSGLIVISAMALWASDRPVPLNVKVGLWQSTTTITTSGELPIPPELLSRLTPEQRARMEERLKAQPGEHSMTFTEEHCLTKRDLEKGLDLGGTPKGAECTQSILTSTDTKAKVQMVCDAENIKGEGIIDVEALGSENVKGSGHMTAGGNGHTVNRSSTFTAKWLGPKCGDTK